MKIFEYAHESGLKALKAANEACSKRLQLQTNVLVAVAEGMPKIFASPTRKIPKYSDTRKIAVIILKFEQCGSTIE